jgi:beta-mannosidase
VRLDLLRINKIPDPFLGLNNEASQWIDAYDWWYRRELSFEPSHENGINRRFILLDGVDYQCSVYSGNEELGSHVGMYSRQVYEIPQNVDADGTLCLRVRVSGGRQLPGLKRKRSERVWQKVAERALPHAEHTIEFPDRYATLKCQMGYGWDFAPKLLTCGIWDTAWLVGCRDIFIRDVWVQGLPDGRVRVTLKAEGKIGEANTARFRVRGKNFECTPQFFEFQCTGNETDLTFSFQLDNPQPWNPWDRGRPNVYELVVTLADAKGELDTASASFGLRSIELHPNPGSAPGAAPWTFTINDKPEFIRGANWVPADAIPARVTEKNYATLLEMARDANINLLRVWGGGLKEKRAFYDACDELGILVWQEFPFAGGGVDYYPNDNAYLQLVVQETSSIVQKLRNHPSVVLWCGGNEYVARANQHLINTVRNVLATHDGMRPFKPASPSRDESHNWRVWHGMANTRDYEKESALFLAEFGLQAIPNYETLVKFIPTEELYPPSECWRYHNAEVEKLWRYAEPVLKRRGINEVALTDLIDASQEAQLRGLQIAVEYARRNKPRVSGCAVWQFNEPWYSICWSLVDYTRTPKKAYRKIKELYNPVLVCFAYPYRERAAGDIVSGQVWLVNDLLTKISATCTAYHNGEMVLSLHVEVPANETLFLQDIDVRLAPGANELVFELSTDTIFSTNEYDLNYCDVGEIALKSVLIRDGAAWLRTS